MRPGFVPATPFSVATMGARLSDIPSFSAAWDITRSKAVGWKAASCPSDETADTSGGSTDFRNGIPTILNAACASSYETYERF